MPERRRLMVGLMVTGPVSHELDGLRRALGAEALLRIAPHITLVPPLNVRDDALPAALEHVRSTARNAGPIAVEIGQPATFFPRAPVLYLEIGGDLDALAALRSELVSGPLTSPEGREKRAFVPHVTLDQRIDPGRLAHGLKALASYKASFCFERVTVLEQDAEHRWWPMSDVALGKAMTIGRGSLDLELSVVQRPDPVTAAFADELWDAYRTERYGTGVRAIERYMIVARSGGERVGFADGEVRGSVMRLGRLAVRPTWRDKGVGSHLLRSVELLALERGCDRVRLETLAGERAERFYAEHGFKVTAKLPRWLYERDFSLMERAVGP